MDKMRFYRYKTCDFSNERLVSKSTPRCAQVIDRKTLPCVNIAGWQGNAWIRKWKTC